MLTKGAIGNLVNRYRAVLKKCNLINTFGSLAVASMLVLGGVGVANAEDNPNLNIESTVGGLTNAESQITLVSPTYKAADAEYKGETLTITSSGNAIGAFGAMSVEAKEITLTTTGGGNGLYAEDTGSNLTVTATENLTITSSGHGINNGTPDGNSITINAQKAVVTITADENAVVARGSEDSSIEIYGKTVTLESTGKAASNTAKGHVIVSHQHENPSNSSIVISATDGVTLKASEGHYAILATTSSNITVDGGTKTTITGGVRAHTDYYNDANANQALTNLTKDFGIVESDKHTVNIDVKGDEITIDALGERGVYAKASHTGGDNLNVTIGDGDTKSVSITNAEYGVYAQYRGSSVEINATNLTIDNPSVAIFAGNCKDDSSTDTSTEFSVVNINATNTEIKNAETGIWALSKGNVNIDGGLVLTANEAIVARGDSVVNINESGNHKVQITGDIKFDNTRGSEFSDEWTGVNANIDINLTTKDSFLDGSIYYTDSGNKYTEDPDNYVQNMNLKLSNGASWYVPESSLVSNLEFADGNVYVAADAVVSAANASGNGNINIAIDSIDDEDKELGKFNAAAGNANLKVQAAKNNVVLNAEQVDASTLAILLDQVSAETATVAAYAPEGDVVGATTVTKSEDGIKTTVAKNTLMDAALQQASVNTVALDRILTNDVRKRLGDIRADQNKTGVWMRWDGGKLKGDSGLTNNFNTIQIGGDTKVAKNCRLGVAGSFTHGDTDFARGNGELEGFSFAAYATWMGENGMFADIVARLGHFSTEMNVEGRTGDMDNRVASLSGEYGWRFNVCDQFFVEPQVELAYTYVNSEDLKLGEAEYSFDSVDSLTGRAGLVAGWNLPDDRGNVYARASVVQQFMGDAKISGTKGIAHNVQEIDGDDTWLEYGIGANIKLTDKTYIWADVERTEGAEIDEEWRGTVGVRFSF